MHGSAMVNAETFKLFLEKTFPGQKLKILDVGGLNVNGSVRPLFEAGGHDFCCLDMNADASVDVVSPPGEPFPFGDGAFDAVVSTSCFEHDPIFWLTFKEIARVTRVDGFVYVNAPSNEVYHGYPGDNWRFYKDAPAALAFWASRKGHGERYAIQVVDHWIDQTEYAKDNVMIFRRGGPFVETFVMDDVKTLVDVREIAGVVPPKPVKKKFGIKKKAAAPPPPPP